MLPRRRAVPASLRPGNDSATLLSGSELVYPREAIVAGVAGTIIAKCTISAKAR